MVLPWNLHEPAIWWWSCVLSQKRLSENFSWCGLKLSHFLHGFFCAWVSESKLTLIDWSNVACLVSFIISCTSGWDQMPDVPGFSMVKCLPPSIWILQTNVCSFKCSLDCSCVHWIFAYMFKLLWALNLFHEHHGARSGATQMCFGRKRTIIYSSSIWPLKMDKSPCFLVNLSAFPLA